MKTYDLFPPRKNCFFDVKQNLGIFRGFICGTKCLSGAGNGIRTRDICLGKATLYH